MLLPVLIAVGAVNLVTFAAFGLDKRLARLERRRIPESRLLGLSFATGLFGGWIGMRLFRHKTRKRSFRRKMLAVSIINPVWVMVWASASGALA